MIYAFAALALASLACAIYFGRIAFKAKDETMAVTDRLHAEARLHDEEEAALLMERDALSQKLDVATAQLAAAKVRLVTAETQRNEALQEKRAHVAEELRTADAPAAARIVNDILRAPLPRMPQADPTPASDGSSGTAGVQPAPAPKRTP